MLNVNYFLFICNHKILNKTTTHSKRLISQSCIKEHHVPVSLNVVPTSSNKKTWKVWSIICVEEVDSDNVSFGIHKGTPNTTLAQNGES